MKKPLLFGIILTVCVVIVAIVFAQVYPAGMISYWKFDEGQGTTAFDSVGLNDGTFRRGPPVWTTGVVDGALSFDGVDDYIAIGDIGLGTREFTISLWINTKWGETLVCNNMNFFGGNQGWLFWIFTYGFEFHVNRNEAVIGAYYPDDKSAFQGKWIHLVFTKDATDQTKIYFDGLETPSYFIHDPWVSPNFPDGENIEIGRRWDEDNWPFKGVMDEVAIYNRALTACEIKQHYNNGLAGKGYTLEDSIETLIINVEDLGLPKGIEKSLTLQLDNALNSLERGRDSAAKKQLEAFIYHVGALRDKKLIDEQADALIIAVQCIIDNI